MASEKSTVIQCSDSVDENEYSSLDYIQIDTDVSEVIRHQRNLMLEPSNGDELSEDEIVKAMEGLVLEFTKRYPSSGPLLSMGSLDQALSSSLYNSTKSRPLVLLLYHNQSVSMNIFCAQVLCHKKIIDYLAENFIVWAWDRTHEINYQLLLKMLSTHLGDEVVKKVKSSSIDMYPLLICLMFNNGTVEITGVITGCVSINETLDVLKQAQDLFDHRIETPSVSNIRLNFVPDEDWSMSPSVLTPMDRTSEKFQAIIDEFVGDTEDNMDIDQIENSSWLSHYRKQKEEIYPHSTDEKNELVLAYPCSRSSAEAILLFGFKNDHQDRNKDHGFHFISAAACKDRYKRLNSDHQAALVCRVLVSRAYRINEVNKTNPDKGGWRTDGLDTFVVYSNRSVVPEYYIKC